MDTGLIATGGLLAGVVLLLVVAVSLYKRQRPPALKAVLASAAAGLVLGSGVTAAAFTAGGSGDDEPDASPDRTVFRAIPLPNQEPPGLSTVRFQDSPTNGLEMYVQQGQEVFVVCVAMPDQLAIGSCRSAEVTAVRTEPVADGRTFLVARLKVLEEERAKTETTVGSVDAERYWKTVDLSANPSWLTKWI